MKQHFLLRLIITCLFLAPMTLMAAPVFNVNLANYFWHPYLGRVQLSGTATQEAIGGVDGMLPIYGNQNGFIFADLMGDIASNNAWVLSPGAGFRAVLNNQIIGLYFFGDHLRSDYGQNFWDLSPGVEWITPSWDAHANLYFPTSNSKPVGASVFASSMGNNNFIAFKEGTHNQYDLLFTPSAVIGNGVDVELGYSFHGMKNLRDRVYVGSYYYNPPSPGSSFVGVAAGYEKPLSQNISATIGYGYDHVNQNFVAFTLNLTFGGNSNIYSSDVHDRFMDTVQRHVGIIGTGAGTYAQQVYKNNGLAVQFSNIYFVQPGGGHALVGEGFGDSRGLAFATYGNAAELNQDTLDEIHTQTSKARIYIQGGDSAVYYVNASTATNAADVNGNRGLFVYAGQDFYGRSADYKSLAASNQLPQIQVEGDVGGVDTYSGFITQEGENTFSNLSIVSYTGASGSLASGIVINDNVGAQTVNITNTTISDMYYGVYANNNGNGLLTINTTNSQFNNNVIQGMQVNGGNGTGGQTGSVILNLTSSAFNNNGNAATGSSVGSAAGLLVVNGSDTSGSLTVNIMNSQFNNNGVANGGIVGVGPTPSAGVIAYNYSNTGGIIAMNISNSQFNGNGVANHGGIVDGAAAGIYVENIGTGGPPGSGITILATNSQFNDNGVANDGGIVDGPVAGLMVLNDAGSVGSIIINATNSQFNGNGLINGGGIQNGVTSGLYVSNQAAGQSLSVNLGGSAFANNKKYGIYGLGVSGATTSIDYAGATFSGSLQTNNTNQATGDHINWVN